MPTTSQPAQSGSAIHQHQGQHKHQHYQRQQKQQNILNLELLFQFCVLFWQNRISQQNCSDFQIAESLVLESFKWTSFWLLIFSNLCAKWWGRQFQPHHSLIQRLIRCRFSTTCDEKEKMLLNVWVFHKIVWFHSQSPAKVLANSHNDVKGDDTNVTSWVSKCPNIPERQAWWNLLGNIATNEY